MRVLVAGATGTIGVPLVRALVARGHRVHGLTRDPANRRLLTGLGAAPVVADALDRGALLAAVQGRAADAVIHQLTALKRPPARHRERGRDPGRPQDVPGPRGPRHVGHHRRDRAELPRLAPPGRRPAGATA
jgi:NAD(P)-dependent dehydrogenase (short-subunit alcohol dehydrogenase family)